MSFLSVGADPLIGPKCHLIGNVGIKAATSNHSVGADALGGPRSTAYLN